MTPLSLRKSVIFMVLATWIVGTISLLSVPGVPTMAAVIYGVSIPAAYGIWAWLTGRAALRVWAAANRNRHNINLELAKQEILETHKDSKPKQYKLTWDEEPSAVPQVKQKDWWADAHQS